MVIILAGCDGTGKSTCFNELKRTEDGLFIKESYTSDLVEKRNRVVFLEELLGHDELVVYDRATLLDDLVYDPVMCNRESMLPGMLGKDYLMQLLNQCIIIYFDCDDFVLTERLNERGDDYVTAHQLNKIKNSYERIFKRFNIKRYILNVTDLNETQVYKKVKEVIDEERFKNC